MAASDNLNHVQFYHDNPGPEHRASPMMCAMIGCGRSEHGAGRNIQASVTDIKPSSEYRSVHGTTVHFGPA